MSCLNSVTVAVFHTGSDAAARLPNKDSAKLPPSEEACQVSHPDVMVLCSKLVALTLFVYSCLACMCNSRLSIRHFIY